MKNDNEPVTPPKVALLSELEGKLVSGKAFKPKARPRPVGKDPEGDKDRRAAQAPMVLNEGPLEDYSTGPRKEKKKKVDDGRPKPVFRPGREADKKARQPTLQRMRNIALYQVGQRELSTQGLRDILNRRKMRWLLRLETESAQEHQPLIDHDIEIVIEEMVKQSMIDDDRYAQMKVRGWRGKGWGERRILMELRKKGIAEPEGRIAMREVDREALDIDEDSVLRDESDRQAAETLAQKKRIGPFRRTPAPEDRMENAKLWRREAGVLARAGFGMDIIHDILSRPPDEEDFF